MKPGIQAAGMVTDCRSCGPLGAAGDRTRSSAGSEARASAGSVRRRPHLPEPMRIWRSVGYRDLQALPAGEARELQVRGIGATSATLLDGFELLCPLRDGSFSDVRGVRANGSMYEPSASRDRERVSILLRMQSLTFNG